MCLRDMRSISTVLLARWLVFFYICAYVQTQTIREELHEVNSLIIIIIKYFMKEKFSLKQIIRTVWKRRQKMMPK